MALREGSSSVKTRKVDVAKSWVFLAAMPDHHPTSFVDPEAQLADDVFVGPLAIVEAGAVLGAGCRVEAGAQVLGSVRAGVGNVFGRGSIIGGDPQDLGFDRDTPSTVEIGEKNVFRELVTIHRSTSPGGETRVGDENFLMAGTHLAHDVVLGNHTVLANNVMVAGHVHMGSFVFAGGGAGFHQFVRVGDYAMVQGHASISKDSPPFSTTMLLNRIAGLNVIGLRRAGFDRDQRAQLRDLFDRLFVQGGNLGKNAEEAAGERWEGPAADLLAFVQAESAKGVISRLGKE